MKKKSREWQVRLSEEIREDKNGKMVTLTFNTEALIKLGNRCQKNGYEKDNEICTKAVRMFLERWRKKHKKSVKHWLVTELGHGKYEHVHIHGIIFTDEPKEEIDRIWNNGEYRYGNTVIKDKTNGGWVNEQTINYIVKYVKKMDLEHKYYKPIILCSKGIGKGYLNRQDSKNNKFKDKETREYYVHRNGTKSSLPIYYRNKIYSETEREKLWINLLDKETRYVLGNEIKLKENWIKINIDGEEWLLDNSEVEYYRQLKEARELNERLGYGNNEKNWSREKYENEKREIIRKKRENKEDNRLWKSEDWCPF